MTKPSSVLILKTGQRDTLDGVIDTLAAEPSITLAWRRAFEVEAGLKLLRERRFFFQGRLESVAVVLLIGREAGLPAAVDLIRRVCPQLPIVTMTLESGTAAFSLRDPICSELARIINALIREEAVQPSPQVVAMLAIDGAAPPRTLPILHGVDPGPSASGSDGGDIGLGGWGRLGDVLEAGLAWTDAATRLIIEIWSTRREESPGFSRSWDAFAEWLARLAGISDAPADEADAAYRRFKTKIDEAAREATPLARVADLLDHDELSLKLLLIVTAGELDIRFHRIFGVLLADVGPRPPTVSLACAIIAAATPGASPARIRRGFAALDRLRGLGLIMGAGDAIAAADEPLRVDPRVLDWLLTGDPERLIGDPERAMVRPAPDEALALLPDMRRAEVEAAMDRAVAGQAGSEAIAAILLAGSQRGWIEAEAVSMTRSELLIGPPAVEATAEALRQPLRALVTAARLAERRLIVDLGGGGAGGDTLWTALAPLLGGSGAPALVLTDEPARLLALTPGSDIVVARVPPPRVAHRAAAVRTALRACGEHDPALADRLAEQFPIALARIPHAVALALSAAAAANRANAPEDADWLAGFRAVAGARLPRLARRLEPRPRTAEAEFNCLDPVILPAAQKTQLRTIVKHVRLGRTVLDEWGFGDLLDARGVAALFSGESGTGKTMAAHAIASELATDLYAVDLSQIVSKYIGETEKNLDIVFEEAEQSGAVLLFDEADALFGKRSAVTSAHDRYANIEVSYLLQRMQQFSGLALLTSNLPDNMDSAFTRRLRFTVEFPRPGAHDRLRIWEQSLPAGRRAPGLDLRPIAGALDVTGGTIRQMALHMAMLAAYDQVLIGREQLVAGVTSELLRLGAYSDVPRVRALYAEVAAARAA